MDDDPPDPALEGTPILELMNLCEDLNKAFLKHVFSVFPAFCIPVADRQHLGAVSVIQLLLR
jgi:hypothetical protein